MLLGGLIRVQMQEQRYFTGRLRTVHIISDEFLFKSGSGVAVSRQFVGFRERKSPAACRDKILDTASPGASYRAGFGTMVISPVCSRMAYSI